MGETASFDMVGIVSEVDLYAVIYATFDPSCHLFSKNTQQRRFFIFFLIPSCDFGISRYTPRFADEEGSFKPAMCAIVSGSPFRDSMLGRPFLD